MDNQFAQKMAEITTQFYAAVADSFSETRLSAWAGWQQVLNYAEASSPAKPDGISRDISKRGINPVVFNVFDVACGNLRFEHFLAENGVLVDSVLAIDNCLPLVESGGNKESFPFPVIFKQTDILQELTADDKNLIADAAHLMSGATHLAPQAAHLVAQAANLAPQATQNPKASSLLKTSAASFNLSVCFGFMHHIPLPQQRKSLMQTLTHATCPGGIIALSFWQFEKDARIFAKAQKTTERGQHALNINFTDKNDFLLGWKDTQNVFRYCHNYTEQEIDSLIATLRGVQEIARFSADGSQGNLNRYVILKVNDL